MKRLFSEETKPHVWTPKRILIYFMALLGFLALFGVIVTVLGWVDGLPTLPPHYVWNPNPAGQDLIDPGKMPERDIKIRQAFGNECEEYGRASKIWLATKGAVLAINKFEIIQESGRVKLSPFSVGLFTKNKGDQRFPEITTVQADFAYLTLDRPITSLTDLSRSKVVAVELGGDKPIKIKNNRKTQELNDDLEMRVSEGRLFYEDARNLIWSDGVVELLDTQSQPDPMKITAIGLQVNLSKDVSPNRDKKAPAKKSEGVSGVEKITLLSNVDMHLYVDARAGFMAGPEELAAKRPKTAPGKADPKDKAHVHIKTNGKFTYDLLKDSARFDAPEQKALLHDRVIVTRHQNATPPKVGVTTDLLDCDRLDLQFRKKTSADPGGTDKDIESAIATAKPGALVEFQLESEEMKAHGLEMRYFAPTPTSGPRTIVKGSPMHAFRQGHQIQCEELHLTGADKAGNGQEAFAKGPGKIDLLDKQTGRHATHILFRNSFAATKDKDGDRVFDLLTLRGDPTYIDEERKQELRAAQFMHVWLEDVKVTPSAKEADPSKKGEPATAKRQRPHRIECFEKVQLRSPQLNILSGPDGETKHLTVYFADQKAPRVEKGFDGVPAFVPVGPPDAVAVSRKNPDEKGLNAFNPLPTQKSGDLSKADSDKPKKPIELTASEITAYVATNGNSNELLEFVAEGSVHVTQAAEQPKDKGLDITAAMLNLRRHPGGDVLKVFGEARKLAQLQFNETYLWGPNVTIDQVQNLAIVEGTGAMHMPSNTTLDGKKKEGHIRIHWNKEMRFNGRSASFYGGVEAFQGNGKMLAQEMQVTLDKPVQFKHSKDSQNAKVDRIVSTGKDGQPVMILEEERDKANKILSYRRLLLGAVDVDNLEQHVYGSGPGLLDFIGHSAAGEPGLGINGPNPPANNGPKKNDDVLKHTRVRFKGQMVSIPTVGGGRQTTFYDDVRVDHRPGNNPNAPDPNVVGKDGLKLMDCQKLTVIQRKVGDKSSQEMIAEGGTGFVSFETEQFRGRAKLVKYDERNDTIIFGGGVTIYKMPTIQGARPEEYSGESMQFNRKTNTLSLGGGKNISF